MSASHEAHQFNPESFTLQTASPTQMTGIDSHVFSGNRFCCITTASSTVISGDMDPRPVVWELGSYISERH